MKALIFLIGALLNSSNLAYSQTHVPSPSRTRGALLFTNYCSGCHSLRYLSWQQMLNDLHVTMQSSEQITPHLHLTLPALASSWPRITMAPEDAKIWFGKIPPDLSLISRQRGAQWINAYLQGFYPDQSRRFGVNNHLFPNTMMPNVLESLNDEQIADITHFLEYAAEPAVLIRMKMGWFVLGFLLLLCGLYYLRWRWLLKDL